MRGSGSGRKGGKAKGRDQSDSLVSLGPLTVAQCPAPKDGLVCTEG